MPRAFRLLKEKWAGEPLSGEGARTIGGRWNLPGTACVYTASTPELTVLEAFVHVGSDGAAIRWALVTIDIPDDVVHIPAKGSLPSDWVDTPVSPSSQKYGTDFAASGIAAVLAVPSVIMPDSSNYILFCTHSDFGRINVIDTRSYSFDPRMWKTP
jgi:RES domain-containing protein